MEGEAKKRLDELREQINFLERTVTGLEDSPDVRKMRKDLQKKQEEYMDIISSSHARNWSEKYPTPEDEKNIREVEKILNQDA